MITELTEEEKLELERAAERNAHLLLQELDQE